MCLLVRVQVPRARGAVRAGERARPGAGEQGVRLPQGPPRRAPLLAPGREQRHGPWPRRAFVLSGRVENTCADT